MAADQRSDRTIAIRAKARELLDAADDTEDTHVTVQVSVDATGRHGAAKPSLPPLVLGIRAALGSLVDVLRPPAWARGVVLILVAAAGLWWLAGWLGLVP